MTTPSREDPHPLDELEAALVRWRALLLLGDLQRRAYLEQQEEPPGEGERLYRRLALRLAAENQLLRARVAELEASRGDDHAEDPAP